MNNTITDDYCSFKVSKLLKEKGFDSDTENSFKYYAYPDGTQIEEEIFDKRFKVDPSTWWKYKMPTHALALKWIRKNFGIEIYFRPERNARKGVTTYYYGISKICDTNHLEIIEVVDLVNSEYPSMEQATEAALLYTLNNLI